MSVEVVIRTAKSSQDNDERIDDDNEESSEDGTYFYFGSNSDVVDFNEWVLSLDADTFPTLRAFVEQGEAKDTAKLGDEIEAALENEKTTPTAPGVMETVESFVDIIGVGSPDETIAFAGE